MAAKECDVTAIYGKSMERVPPDFREAPGKDFVIGLPCHGPVS
jgi:hypothetical protein